MQVIIRCAQPKDAEAILDLAKTFATSFLLEEAALRAAFSQLLGTSSTHFAVAEVQGEVIGYVLAFQHLTFYANGAVAWVEEITVREEDRQHGVGRTLMQSAEQWAKAQNCRLIALATRRAEKFYTALDYELSAHYFRKLL